MWKPAFFLKEDKINDVRPVKSDSSALFFERMEPKILLSADALSGLIASDPFSDNDMNAGLDINQSADFLTSSFSSEAINEPLNIDALSDLIGGGFANSENLDSIDALGALLGEIDDTTAGRQEIIFVDAATPDYQQLLDGLTNNKDVQYQIFILQSDQNGIEQISSALSQHQGIDAIHLVSHGDGEGLQLGNTWLSNTNLNSYNEQLQQWNDALDQDADILIYGCDLASQQEGQSLINNLAALTQADVTASDDLTGASQLGGDWQLEYTIGEIESTVAFNAATQETWMNVLGTINVTTFADVVDADADLTSLDNLLLNPGDDGKVSLREAVIAANADIGSDTIELDEGRYYVDIDNSGYDDIGYEGDIDITDALEIKGSAVGKTIIDGDYMKERAFDVRSTNVSISNLRIVNSGYEDVEGGGLRVASGAELDLTDVVFKNNFSYKGGGILNDGGTLHLDNVSFIRNNDTYNNGGAIYNHNGHIEITDSAFIRNWAKDYGGAIYNDGGTINIANTTFTENTARNDGGAIYNNAGDVNITNSKFITNGVRDTAGAIYNNSGDVDLTQVYFANNYATGTNASGVGGAIFNAAGNITGSDVVFYNNHANAIGGAIYNENGNVTLGKVLFNSNDTNTGHGGAISNKGGVVTLTNATFSENYAYTDGGAISSNTYGTLNIYSSTFTGNHSDSTSKDGIAQSASSVVNIKNSLLNDASGNIVGGTINSLGSNIDTNGTVRDKDNLQQFTAADLVGTSGSPLDVQLDVLADNGGFGKTHALLTGSVAINAGTNGGGNVPTTDQRGVIRSLGLDVGAYETSSYLDQFNATAYNGNDGSLTWMNDWQEVNDNNNANSGQVSITNRLGEQGIELKKTNSGVWREADLSGADTAILSFSWAMFQTDLNDTVTIEISTDGGTNWTVVDTFSGPLDHSSMKNASYDISAYIDSDTRIKFETTSGFSGNDRFFFDNVSIELTGDSANVSPVDSVPVLNNTTLVVSEGQTITVTSEMLSADDVETVPAALEFTVSNVNGGQFEFSSASGVAITSFTQGQLNSNAVVFVDDGDKIAPSFNVSVNDGGGNSSATVAAGIAFTNVNDAPVATNNTVSTNEDTSFTFTDSDFTFTDIENDALVSITIGGLDLNGGTLTHSSGGVTVTNGMAVTALQLADLTFTPSSNNSTNSSFTYTVNDADLGVSAAVMNVIVNAVNDAPIATNLDSTSSYTEGDSSVALANIVINDLDAGEIVTATLTLLNVDAGQLSATGGATYDAASGVWTITGTVANVNQALASINFIPANTAITDSNISIVIDDGDEDNGGPLLGNLTIKLNAPNDIIEETTNPVVPEPIVETTPSDNENVELTEEQVDTVLAEQEVPSGIVEDVYISDNNQITNGDVNLITLPADNVESNFLQNNPINSSANKIYVSQESDSTVARLREQVIAFNDPLTLSQSDQSFMVKLNDLREEMLLENDSAKKVVGSSLTVSAGFSVGYVVWLARSGVIMSSVLSSLPAWRLIDPLPVLASLREKDEDDDDESLESIVGEEYKDEQQN